MEAKIVSSIEVLRDLKGEWNELLAKSKSNTIFLTWEWAYSWAECFVNGDRELFVICLYDDGNRPIGIAPWYRIGVRAPMSVMGVVTISSPGSGSTAATAKCTAAVPDAQA